MKPFILCISLFFTLQIFAQDPQLFYEDWELIGITLDDQFYPAPKNSEVTVNLIFDEPNEIAALICSGTGGAGLVTFDVPGEFYITEGLFWLAGNCNLPENEAYSNLHNYDFWDNSLDNPFMYEIVELGSQYLLSITASNGNRAEYGARTLHTNEFNTTAINIVPNPTSSNISIKLEKGVIAQEVQIHSLQGALVFKETKLHTDTIQLNIDKLPSGIYFVTIIDSKKQRFVERIIKE